MKTLSLVFLLALAGCSPSESKGGRLGNQLLQWVPFETSQVSAQQIMQSHGFVCSIVSFDSLAQMTNRSDAILDGPQWHVILERNGSKQTVTNISYLDCKLAQTNKVCDVRFVMLNGQTAGIRASGSL